MDGRLIFLHHYWRSMESGRGTEGERPVRRASRKGEGTYDPELLGSTTEKSRLRTRVVTVLKLTQVGEMSILRRSR